MIRRPSARHVLTACLAALAIALALGQIDRGAAAQTTTPSAEHRDIRVGPIALTVADLDAAVSWYHQTLGFQRVTERTLEGESFEHLIGVQGAKARVVRMRLGTEEIELWQFLSPAGRAFPADSRSNDRWFQHIAIIVRDMDEAYARLRGAGVREASLGPQTLPTWNTKAAGIRAFYFRDPDGHYLEILEFPTGKGDARWQNNDELFLGIDHTAIVTWDTDASLRFYRDLLGLRVAGGSENYGVEQEKLNTVFPARLRITTLRGDAGPAIELLEYLTPRDGRPMPPDSHPTDLWHWHIGLVGPDPDSAFASSRAAGGWPVSPGAQENSILVCDPDGHQLLIDARAE